MSRSMILPALAGCLALGLVACDESVDTSERRDVPVETRTGQSGGTVPPTVAGTGTTNSPGLSVPGASGTAPIGSRTPLPPGTGSTTGSSTGSSMGATGSPGMGTASPAGTATGTPGQGMGDSGGGPPR